MQETYSYIPPMAPMIDREQLIQGHLSMVDFWVDRMVTLVPAYMTRDDIYSAAMMGLLDAANRFDPAKGILFKTFAERRVRGAVLDEARKMDSCSRTLRQKQTRISQALESLRKQLGRDPDESEVADHIGVSLEQYRQQLMEVSRLGFVSLQESLGDTDDGRSLQDTIADTQSKNPQESYESKELARALAGGLEKLTEKERFVISLFYYEELTQKEIAEVLSLSEGRVSQLHSQALIKLKTRIRKAI